ncbi:30S ribosomal protein S19 [Candidatus Tiddalikarchaeum anstoanum]|nr:30S ribosomal protein S19 [Candidatus Tiddalikarchaeum anstoanum]
MVDVVAKKETYYKGVKTQDLNKIPNDQLLKLMTSRARRSLKRGQTYDQKLLIGKIDDALKLKAEGKEFKQIKTHSRDAIIIPKMVGLTIGVHNGIKFEPIDIKPEMVGHYLGEFALTRKRVVHGKNAAAPEGGEAAAPKEEEKK